VTKRTKKTVVDAEAEIGAVSLKNMLALFSKETSFVS
jgi:hypothetical protein